jgi:hypothetical protein
VINDVPAVIPVNTPVAAPTVTTAGLELVHVPPTVVLVHVSEDPIHIGSFPVIV